MARGGPGAQGKRHARCGGRWALLEARRSLLILVEEEAVGTKYLVEGVGRVKAHVRQLVRECRVGTHWTERTCADRDAHDGGKRERDGRNATQGKSQGL